MSLTHAADGRREAKAVRARLEELEKVDALGIRDAHVRVIDRETAVEIAERKERAVDGGGTEDLLPIEAVLPREPDGEALVEPRRNVLAEDGVLERDVRELVTKHLVEIRRVTAARGHHADEHEAKAGIRHAARVRGWRRSDRSELGHLAERRRDAHLDVREHVLAEQIEELPLHGFGVGEERGDALGRSRRVRELEPAEVTRDVARRHCGDRHLTGGDLGHVVRGGDRRALEDLGAREQPSARAARRRQLAELLRMAARRRERQHERDERREEHAKQTGHRLLSDASQARQVARAACGARRSCGNRGISRGAGRHHLGTRI